jgi:hypothetical protein
MSQAKQETPVVVPATAVPNATVIATAPASVTIDNAVQVRTCRGCGVTFHPKQGVSTRESMRCDACNKDYEDNFIEYFVRGSCSLM